MRVIRSSALNLSIVAATFLTGCATTRYGGVDEVALAGVIINPSVLRGMTEISSMPVKSGELGHMTAVLLGRRRGPSTGAYQHFDDLTLATRIDSPTGTNWTGAGVRARSRSPDDPSSIEMRCLDLNADGRDEIVVIESYAGCGWDPGVYRVFTTRGREVVPIGEVASEELGCDSSLSAEARETLPCTYAIGDSLGHCGQPRWTDYYRFDGTRLILANKEMPRQFRKWPDELRRLLQTSPSDAELWYFLGRALLILSRDEEALLAFRNASDLGYRAHDSGYSGLTNWQ